MCKGEQEETTTVLRQTLLNLGNQEHYNFMYIFKFMLSKTNCKEIL